MDSVEALEGREAYSFEAVLSRTLDDPEASLRAAERGTTTESVSDDDA